MTALGSWVRRAALVRDDLAAIAAEVRRSQRGGADLLLVTGGLGPTDDDLTLAGVAQALGRPLQEDLRAHDMVAARYRSLYESGRLDSPLVTPQRLKMAVLPRGAAPIENPVGAAPGVLLRLRRMAIVCLPGVPREMKAIFSGPLLPHLEPILGGGITVERAVTTPINDESALAGPLREITGAFPQIYIKSHAGDFERGPGIRITLSLRGSDRESLERILDAAVHALRDHVPLEETPPLA